MNCDDLELDPDLRHVCGAFVLYTDWRYNGQPIPNGSYFERTKDASSFLGYSTDKVGKNLRQKKGGRDVGWTCLRGMHFISAEVAAAFRPWRLNEEIKRAFPWLSDHINWDCVDPNLPVGEKSRLSAAQLDYSI